MISNKRTSIYATFIVFILDILVLPCRPQTLSHVSKSTNCTITFDMNIQNNSNPGMQFVNCTRFLCLRNLINGHCSNLQKFELPQQRCYRECCGASTFDFMTCENYNQLRLSREQASDQKLVIALVASLLGLLLAVTIFAIFYLKCCSKEDSTLKNKQPNESQFQWKDVNFTNEKCCHRCKETGAFVLLPCGIYYHLKCLNSNQNWECLHCSKNIRKVKILCPVCLKKSIIIRASNFDELDKKIVEMYQYHPYRCMDEMNEEMDTERKFTESTKQ